MSTAPVSTPPTATPPATATPPVTTPPVATPPVTTPPVATPPVTTPPVATPPVTTPPVATPPVTTPPVATPPVTTPPVATPPVTTPPIATPPVTTPPVSTPPVTTPPVATPPATTPPVATPPVASPPAPPPATPPVASPPAPPPASPPPPTTTPPVSPPPSSSPPPPSPPPPSPSPPPPSPPPPSPPPNGPPPPPGTPAAPPPPSPPPPSPIAPPPPFASPPPPISNSHPPSPPLPVNHTKSGGGGIGATTVVGIAVGGVVAIVLVAVIWLCLAKKKPKQKLNYAIHRVGHSPAPGGAVAGSATSDGLSSYGARTEFLDSGDLKPPPPPPGMSEIVGAAGVGGLAAAAIGGKKPIPPPPQGNNSAGNTRPWFTYEELEEATNGFSAANVLGEGGFGRVYKGVIAGNQQVAVKQLTIGGGQGEREFRAEVEIISRVHHRHLVSLVGYCIADSQRLLVYDFVPNGTLEDALHGAGKPVMDWATRMKIALGSARGLAYLHEDCHPRIIHRDIKASNILLDNQWEAQVADFGLAKLANDTHTHVTTRVMGTFGYLAPEYALSGKLTDKSDVYSFGVVLLELITGKRPVDVSAAIGEESLVEWARPVLTQALESGNVDALADPNLMEMYNEKEMFRMVETAAACVRHSSQKRPKMAMVVRALETEGADLNQGSKPGYSTVYGGFDSVNSSEFDSSQYKANLKKFRQVAYGTSTSQYSSDYSAGTTSDYGGAAHSASSSEFGSSSREHPTVIPPVRGPNAQESTSSGDRSGDEVRLDIRDEPSPRGYSTGLSPKRANTGVGLSKMGPQIGTLPLPPNRRPVGTGLSVRSPRGGESVRSRSPAQKVHQRKGSETGNETGMLNRLGSFASTVFSRDSTPQPPPPPPNFSSGEFPESKYSTEDESTRKVAKANRLEEGSRPLLSAHKTKTVKFDFDG